MFDQRLEFFTSFRCIDKNLLHIFLTLRVIANMNKTKTKTNHVYFQPGRDDGLVVVANWTGQQIDINLEKKISKLLQKFTIENY